MVSIEFIVYKIVNEILKVSKNRPVTPLQFGSNDQDKVELVSMTTPYSL